MSSKSLRISIGFVGMMLLIAIVSGLWRQTVSVSFSEKHVKFPGNEWEAIEPELWLVSSDHHSMQLRVKWNEHFRGPVKYEVQTFSVAHDLRINDTPIVFKGTENVFSSPDVGEERVLNLSLKNQFYLLRHFSWSMRRSLENPWIRLQFALGTMALAITLTLLFAWVIRSKGNLAIGSIFLGILLIVLWSEATPFWSRSYDWKAHIEYLDYMRLHWSVPPAQSGWQMYQPPLYYATSVIWMQFMSIISGNLAVEDVQGLSILLSVLTLFLGWRIACEFWPQKNDLRQVIATLLLAVFPGIVCLSSQISNDVLITTISFAWLLAMIRWEKAQGKKWWLIGAILVGLGILTKSTGLFLFVTQCAILVTQGNLSLKKKAKLLATIIGIVGLLAGWLLVLRFWIEGETTIVGNIHELYPPTTVPNSISTLLSFHPIAILVYPFNHDLLQMNLSEYFWDYFYRSAFFGSHGSRAAISKAVLVLVSSYFLLPLLVMGAVKNMKVPGYRSLLCTGIIFLSAVMSYRIMYPMSSNQHFRFVTILAAPICMFIAMSLNVKSRRVRDTFLILILSFCIACTWYQLKIIYFQLY